MRPMRRNGGRSYELDVRWRGYPRLRLACGTTNKGRAGAMGRTLTALRDAGRRDLLGLLAEHRLTLAEVHDTFTRDPATLEHLKAKAESPRLGDLVEEWLAWCNSPAGLSPKTRRPYARKTVACYRSSWEGFFEVLPRGRDSSLADLTRGLVLAYRQSRMRATGGRRRQAVAGRSLGPATFNRDMAALGAFLTWCQEVRQLHIDRPRLPREREPSGRERWLSGDELGAFEAACTPEWWPFFATLFQTGMRLGEVQGLRGADIRLSEGRILIQEATRRVKSQAAVRMVPIPPSLHGILAVHLARVAPGPADLAFPDAFQRYDRVRCTWNATCAAAGIAGARPHDARHTFAVHAAQVGVPIVRLQKLLGHATAAMTMRYMQHAPEAFLDADAAAIDAHMAGITDREAQARVTAARWELRRA